MERRQFLHSTMLGASAITLSVASPGAAAVHLILSAGECHVRPNPPLRAAYI
jgi:hypothetical protein